MKVFRYTVSLVSKLITETVTLGTFEKKSRHNTLLFIDASTG
jgi:hypothetical protein